MNLTKTYEGYKHPLYVLVKFIQFLFFKLVLLSKVKSFTLSISEHISNLSYFLLLSD